MSAKWPAIVANEAGINLRDFQASFKSTFQTEWNACLAHIDVRTQAGDADITFTPTNSANCIPHVLAARLRVQGFTASASAGSVLVQVPVEKYYP